MSGLENRTALITGGASGIGAASAVFALGRMRAAQFAEEDEVLYPPCTMLRVKRRDEGDSSVKSPEKSPSPGKNSRLRKASTVAMAFSRPSSSMRESDGGGGQAELQVVETREEGKSFVAIRVEPAFV